MSSRAMPGTNNPGKFLGEGLSVIFIYRFSGFYNGLY
jgi:hypothetical protein